MSNIKQKTNNVYKLIFNLLDIPEKHLPAFTKQMLKIRTYGNEIPEDTDELIFYIGESKRPEQRHKEHQYHAHQPNSIEYNYNSRQMIRLLDQYKIPWHCEIIKTIPAGEYTAEFEAFQIARYAALGHPLTNMVAGLQQPSISRLGAAETLEEYRAIKQQIKEEQAAKKRHKHRSKKHRNYIKLHNLPEPDVIHRVTANLSEYFTELADQTEDNLEATFYRMFTINLKEHLWCELPFSTRYLSVTDVETLMVQADDNDLPAIEPPAPKLTMEQLIEQSMTAEIETPAEQLARLS